MKQIPNLFTLLNLLFGALAIVVTLQQGISIAGDETGEQWVIMPEKIWYASLFIGLAAVVDFLDGFLARLMKASSEMGKQLDSLADVVSFGVAPSMILYQFLRLGFARQENGLEVSALALLPAFLLALGAAWRLAKFNIATDQQFGFKGVPTPAIGILVASFPLIYWTSEFESVSLVFENIWFIYATALVLCWLMVSNLPLLALKFSGGGGIKKFTPFILMAALGLGSILFLQWMAVPVVFLGYIVLSLAFKNKS